MATPRTSLLKRLKHTFVASSENEFHPHILKKEAIIAVLIAVVLIEGAVLGQEFVSFKNTNYLASVLPSVVTDLTNDARTQDGLALLTPDPVLNKAAQEKADDMSAKGYFAHVSPTGVLPWHWFDAAGYNYEYAGENLAVNFDDSKQLVDAWLASPAHRANILGSHFTSIGVGMAQGTYEGKSTLFVVQFFAKPAPVAAAKTSTTPAAKTPAPAPATPGATPAPAKPLVAKVPAAPTPETQAIATALSNVPATEPVITQRDVLPESALAPANAPVVLGAETARTGLITSLLASPVSSAGYAFGVLAVLFMLALILGLLFHIRLPRFDATMGGLAVLSVLLAFAILNGGVIFSSLKLPADTQSAAVYRAL